MLFSTEQEQPSCSGSSGPADLPGRRRLNSILTASLLIVIGGSVILGKDKGGGGGVVLSGRG